MKSVEQLLVVCSLSIFCTIAQAEPVTGWLHWRGPMQNGASVETNLPDTWGIGGDNHQWDIALQGRGTPVIARYGDTDRLFVWGYRGSGYDLQEVLACVDPASGEILWEHRFNDFLSDHVYNRYAIGAPTVDAETGHVYLMISPGVLMCFTPEGDKVWERSMLEEFGRLTFPNGRVGAPAVDGPIVIVNVISSNWGAETGGRNRFYGFDKRTGELIWSSDPGAGPPYLKDSSFSSPVFDDRAGMRVFYAGTGCGNIVAVNARTGDPLWRYQMCIGGVNSTPLIVGDKLIAVHGVENLDDSRSGRMVALDLNQAFAAYLEAREQQDFKGPLVLDVDYEIWRNDDVGMFTSSPVYAEGKVYQVTQHGTLHRIDAQSGETEWTHRLGSDQLHASPLYADGKLYVPTWHDGFYIIRPTAERAEVLAQVDVGADMLGSPSVWRGRVYVHSLQRLYCFGDGGEAPALSPVADRQASPNPPARLQIIPVEVRMRPGESLPIRAVPITHEGDRVEIQQAEAVRWEKFVPPGALIRAEMNAEFDGSGHLVAAEDGGYSAGAFRGRIHDLEGTFRGRILPSPPYTIDFSKHELTEQDGDGSFAHPPLPWIGARGKWKVREHDGEQVLVKTLDNVLFQRSMVFIGHPDDADYTVQADIMPGGSRRMRSDVGVINQRYIITLRGNNHLLEVFSNHDRVKYSVPFTVRPNQWYTLRARVDVAEDGSGVVRAKVWERGGEEPEEWTLEMEHPVAHRQGSPGFYGMTPQSQFPVYIANLVVTPNE